MYYIVDGALYVKCFTVLELWSTSLRRSARQLEEAQLLLIHWALLYGRSVISRLGQYWPIAPQDNATIIYFGLVTWRLNEATRAKLLPIALCFVSKLYFTVLVQWSITIKGRHILMTPIIYCQSNAVNIGPILLEKGQEIWQNWRYSL
jgi:hypothetical protein